jgi:hypothetical protein
VAKVNVRTVAYIAAGVAGLVVATRLLRGASSIGSAVGSTVSSIASGAVAAVQTVNPLNPGNVFNRTAETLTERITGVPGDTPGLVIERWLTGKPAAPARYDADAEDAALGAAMRAAEPSFFERQAARRAAGPWTAVDQEDADEGAAMRGAAFPTEYPTGAAWPGSIYRRP